MAYSRASRGSLQEVTRVRTDGTSGVPSKHDDELEALVQKRAKKSSAYEKYKQQLHSFFDGETALPDHLRDILSTRPGAEEHGIAPAEEVVVAEAAPKKKKSKGARAKGVRSDQADGTKRRRLVTGPGNDYKEKVDAIRKANSPREISAAIDALKEGSHPLPEDIEVLSKALGHSSDSVLEEALQGLLAAAVGPETKGATLLKTRLRNVALVTGSSDVRSLCDDVQTALSGA